MNNMSDWIEWNGGRCPIKDDRTFVEVAWSDLDIETSAFLTNQDYWDINKPLTIKRYRIVKAYGEDVVSDGIKTIVSGYRLDGIEIDVNDDGVIVGSHLFEWEDVPAVIALLQKALSERNTHN